jgi:tetratricopeptide (TPR) repeat protein
VVSALALISLLSSVPAHACRFPAIQFTPNARLCQPINDESKYYYPNGSGAWQRAYASHGFECLREGLYAQAISKLEKARALGADDVPTMVYLGLAYQCIGQTSPARTRWSAAIKVWQSGPEWQRSPEPAKFVALYGSRRYADAAAVFNAGLSGANDARLADDGSLADYNEAKRLVSLAEYPGALAHVRRALSFSPDDLPSGYLLAGFVSAVLGDQKAGTEALESALVSNMPRTQGPPDFDNAQWTAIMLLLRFG